MHRLFPVYYPDIHKNCRFESDELRYFSTLKVTLLDVNNGLGTEQVCCGDSPQYSSLLIGTMLLERRYHQTILAQIMPAVYFFITLSCA